ncbi:MAG: hypothetical protein PVH61_36465 [Candidatus Aminicenantes bacterium]|jgi:hypothetical protein
MSGRVFLRPCFKAAADYKLSEDEIAALNTIDKEELGQVGQELGERISKGYLDFTLLSLQVQPDQPGHNSSHTNTHNSTHTKGE